jgi:pyridoxal phosphate enzyme (YggS family)
VSEIRTRLESLRRRIADAALRAGRDPSSVALLAVSKTQSIEAMREAYAAGQRSFGENYVQELGAKAEALRDLPDLRLHLIGHLQRNKARDAARHAHVIESVDRPELVAELDRRAERDIEVYVEVNVAGEAQKSGCRLDDVPALLERLSACEHLRPRGLMAIPPASDDPEATRPHFRAMRALFDRLRAEGHPLVELSMGMSADFEVAIEEGATLVRVGTALFGARRPKGAG